MQTIEKQTFDEERALYGRKDIIVKNCSFDEIKSRLQLFCLFYCLVFHQCFHLFDDLTECV